MADANNTEGSKGKPDYMLTTTDNPWDPFTQWDEWLSFDTNRGYNTSGMVARIAVTSHDLSEADQARSIQMAIDDIVRENVLGLYTKVARKE